MFLHTFLLSLQDFILALLRVSKATPLLLVLTLNILLLILKISTLGPLKNYIKNINSTKNISLI